MISGISDEVELKLTDMHGIHNGILKQTFT